MQPFASKVAHDRLYLANARYLDHESLDIHEGTVEIERGVNGSLRMVDAIPVGAERINCAGRVVTHSFAIGHHHIYSCLARGMPAPKEAPANFVEILERIWWNLDRKLDLSMIRASALAAGIEAAKCGATIIIDHHSSPNAIPGSLHTIAEALEAIGLSHVLCYELSDRDGPACRVAGLRESRAHLERKQGLVGLHAPFTVSDELLDHAIDLAREFDTGIHIHVAEAESDQEHCLATHGMRCVQRLARFGALDLPRTILAHCIHLDESERAMLGGSRAWVSHQVESNLNNSVGVPSARGFEERVFLGTDGMNGDCLAAARAAFLAGQAVEAPSVLAVYGRLRRVHGYLSSNGFIGDGANNLVVLNYDPPTPITSENWAAHVVYALNCSHVDTVISDGQIIVSGGRCTLVDEDGVMDLAREQASRLWSVL